MVALTLDIGGLNWEDGSMRNLHRTREEKLAAQRAANLKHTYGITVEEFDRRVAAQRGLCAICQEPMGKPHLDHDHRCCSGRRVCGECLRGLLCFTCNTALGKFKDSPEILQRAIDYLRTYQ